MARAVAIPRGKRQDGGQRSDRSAVMFGDVRVVDRLAASIAGLRRVGFDGSMMTRHENSRRWRWAFA